MFQRHEYYLSGIRALRECFASIDSSYLCPNRGETLCIFTASRKNYFPPHSGLSRMDRLIQNSFPKIYQYCGSVQIRPRFFRYDDFIIFCYFAFLKMSGLWQTFCFKTSSAKACIIFISVPKTLISLDHVHLDRNKLKTNKLTKNLALS